MNTYVSTDIYRSLPWMAFPYQIHITINHAKWIRRKRLAIWRRRNIRWNDGGTNLSQSSSIIATNQHNFVAAQLFLLRRLNFRFVFRKLAPIFINRIKTVVGLTLPLTANWSLTTEVIKPNSKSSIRRKIKQQPFFVVVVVDVCSRYFQLPIYYGHKTCLVFTLCI